MCLLLDFCNVNLFGCPGLRSIGRRPGIFARGITTTENFFGIDASKKGRTGMVGATEGQAASGEPDAGIRVPRHVAFVMDGNGRW